MDPLAEMAPMASTGSGSTHNPHEPEASYQSQLAMLMDQPANDRSSIVLCRATEMDVTMIGLQNAGKSSLLRVLAVRLSPFASLSLDLLNSTHIKPQGGEFTIE
jgi:hypothetical protein